MLAKITLWPGKHPTSNFLLIEFTTFESEKIKIDEHSGSILNFELASNQCSNTQNFTTIANKQIASHS